MPNYELGFGSPFYTNQSNGDMGFGAPYNITVNVTSYSTEAEQGFGDIFNPINVFIGGEQIELGDEGGQFLKLFADWKSLVNDPTQTYVGPFKIYLTNDTETFLCKSGLPGYPTETWSDNLGQYVSFIMPTGIPHGIYDIEIYYGTQYSQSLFLGDAIRVFKGSRNLYSKNLRKNIPKFFELGIFSDGGKNYETIYNEEKSNIEKILDSIADEMTTIISGQYTIVKIDTTPGDTTLSVESTINFPDKGILKVGNQELIYSSKTDTSFNLINYIKDDIKKFMPVTYINDNLEKIDNYYLRQIYQYDKPISFNIRNEQWDETFKYLQMAERYTFTNIFNYFAALTSHVDFVNDCVLADANNQVFIILDPTKEFNTSHVDRFIQINDETYYSIGLVDTPHITDPGISVKGLKLNKIATSYWRKAQFTSYNTIELRVKPFNINIDYNSQFSVIYENSIFGITSGFIDKDFIDHNIYFEDYSQIGERNFNSVELGKSDMTAAGVIPKITRKQKTNDNFGTYINPTLDPNLITLIPDNQLQ